MLCTCEGFPEKNWDCSQSKQMPYTVQITDFTPHVCTCLWITISYKYYYFALKTDSVYLLMLLFSFLSWQRHVEGLGCNIGFIIVKISENIDTRPIAALAASSEPIRYGQQLFFFCENSLNIRQKKGYYILHVTTFSHILCVQDVVTNFI